MFVVFLFQFTGNNFCLCLIDDCQDADVPLVELNFHGKFALFCLFAPFLAQLFSEETRGIANPLASWLSSSCKNFDIL